MLGRRLLLVCAVALVAVPGVAGGTAAAAAGRCASAPRPGVDWHGCNLHGRYLRDADLRRANLSDAKLMYATLTDAKLAHATLSRANLTGAKLDFVSSGGIVGTPKALPSPWKLRKGYLVGPRAWLPGANLAHANLSHANLTEAYLYGANLYAANLAYAKLLSRNFHCGVEGGTICADLSHADLRTAKLTNADLSLAIAPYARLARADLTGAHLSQAILPNAEPRERDHDEHRRVVCGPHRPRTCPTRNWPRPTCPVRASSARISTT